MNETKETPTPYQIRKELLDLMTRDLLGPADGPEEIVKDEQVFDRYILGLIAPKGVVSVEPETEAGLENDPYSSEDDTLSEAGHSEVTTLRPTSIGMTFSLEPGATSFCIRAVWGTYRKIQVEVTEENKHGSAWKRIPHEYVSPAIMLKAGRIEKISPEKDAEICIRGRIRNMGKNGWIVTIFLINEQSDKGKSASWLFQPELSVFAPDHTPVFCNALHAERKNENEEDRILEMLYRRETEFATGHGTAVHAELAEGYFDRATLIRTDCAPTYELPFSARPQIPGLECDMEALSNLDGEQFRPALEPLAEAYRKWIDTLKERLKTPSDDLKPYLDEAYRVIKSCEKALKRIREGIEVLENVPEASDAFKFCNKAMKLQRLHTLYTDQKKKDPNLSLESLDSPENHSWYPFQLAFILLNIPTLTDPTHDERSNPTQALADVLWFPTGGGKTEAYLGLTAYTLAMRRLQPDLGGLDGSAGVAVLMRYTLRLLTLQQFQRAAALICACETIRRENTAVWGMEPFRIGLWVGQKSTPNTTEASAEIIRDIRKRGKKEIYGSSPHQLSHCPWCGAEIDPARDIHVETFKEGACRTFVYCPNRECLFSRKQSPKEGLPILVVDEEVYRRLPSLLISTVDKFAQMPWKGESEALFGRVMGFCERHGYRTPSTEDSDFHQENTEKKLAKAVTKKVKRLRPPDLIIQDELHLIDGPLGSMVGLYETVVDTLCSWEIDGRPIRPKVIASSATIRRTDSQVQNLYLRKANVFPPNGLEASDNFFSRQETPGDGKAGRLYLGICAPGIRQKAVMLRTYISTLAAAQLLYNKYGAAADQYMTLVGYFNAIRDLGGMRRALEDVVQIRLKKQNKHGLANRSMSIEDIQELTSRMSAAEIPELLDRLSIPYKPSIKSEKGKKEKVTEAKHIDTILCTNMISVGVDVPRLGLMVVDAQPKHTSEYIQATSRVGRRKPGIVLMVYNWARPRDISHYERFENFHTTLYKQVEALTVTPFTARARDRGLAGILTALLRLDGFEMNDNLGAGKIDPQGVAEQKMINIISSRASLIQEKKSVGDDVRDELNRLVDDWSAKAGTLKKNGSQLGYQKAKSGSNQNAVIPLLSNPSAMKKSRFDCLTSMRGVEPNVNIMMRDFHSWKDEEEEEDE